MKKVAIIQARMASTRLPGKVMRRLKGETVLAHVLKRCAAIPGVEEVVCATVMGADGEEIAQEAVKCGASVFRGSENDVLDRYYQAAKMSQADIVVRVTSDCPLIDPEQCGRVIQALHSASADYACNNMPPSWPAGLDCEAFLFSWLERAAKEAEKPSEREHVTPFIRNHADARKTNVTAPESGLEGHRWTLDNPDDWSLFEKIFDRLAPGPDGWGYQAPLAIVQENPEIAAINSHHHRLAGVLKSLKEDESKGFEAVKPAWVESD